MKIAAIYKGKKKYIIHSYSKTDAGLSIATPPFFTLNIPVGDDELFKSIKQAVEESKEGLPHPKNWNLFMKKYLESIGLRNYKDLQEKFSLCTVQLIDSTYEIIPTINKGLVDGFVDQIEKKLIVPIGMEEKRFVQVLETAFTYCE